VDDEFVVTDLGEIAAAASDRADKEVAEVRILVRVGVGSELGDRVAESANLKFEWPR
jgi:hypothetical protein